MTTKQDQLDSQLQFTALWGTYGENSQNCAAAHCYLLEIYGVKILLDCGWDSSFDVSLLEPLERLADKIDLVLISHGNLEHMGALPYALKNFKFRSNCWFRCTQPVLKFGQLYL